jgi:hypothetical protein
MVLGLWQEGKVRIFVLIQGVRENIWAFERGRYRKMENVTQWRGAVYDLCFTSDITGIWFQAERESCILSRAWNGLIPILRHLRHPWKFVNWDYLSCRFRFTTTLDVAPQIAVNNTGAISIYEYERFPVIRFSKTQAGWNRWINFGIVWG